MNDPLYLYGLQLGVVLGRARWEPMGGNIADGANMYRHIGSVYISTGRN